MFRRLSFIVAVILLASSGALAQINQLEGFGIGAANGVLRIGPGGAISVNGVGVAQQQFDFDQGTGSWGWQGEIAGIGQFAVAGGINGASGVNQNGVAGGLQGQVAGPAGIVQAEALNVGLQQVVFNVGIGGAAGAQGAFAAQGQVAASPLSGISAQAQFIAAAQFGAVVGGPGSNIAVQQQVQGAGFQN